MSFFDKLRSESFVVAVDEVVGLIHGSWMDGEPVDHSDVLVVGTNKFHHRHESVSVVLCEE